MWDRTPETVQGYRLAITGIAHPDGYLEPKLMVGPVYGVARVPNRTQVEEMEPMTETVTIRGGYRRTVETAPPERRLQLNWQNTMASYALHLDGFTSTPDYFTGSTTGSGDAWGTTDALPRLMDGLVQRLKGAQTPVWYLQNVNVFAIDGTAVNWNPSRSRAIYGTLEPGSIIRTEHAGYGEQHTDKEQTRFGNLNFRELV